MFFFTNFCLHIGSVFNCYIATVSVTCLIRICNVIQLSYSPESEERNSKEKEWQIKINFSLTFSFRLVHFYFLFIFLFENLLFFFFFCFFFSYLWNECSKVQIQQLKRNQCNLRESVKHHTNTIPTELPDRGPTQHTTTKRQNHAFQIWFTLFPSSLIHSFQRFCCCLFEKQTKEKQNWHFTNTVTTNHKSRASLSLFFSTTLHTLAPRTHTPTNSQII